MLSALTGLCILLCALTSLASLGITFVYRTTKCRGLALLTYGMAVGLLLHALAGLAVAVLPKFRIISFIILTGVAVTAAAYLVFTGSLREMWSDILPSARISVALWLLLILVSFGVIHLRVQYPSSLPDGMYISKAHSTNVKIQYLTGLPADNYIPFAVAEFMLRGISFTEERPIIPGNEVSNRTVLMSLVSLPFRVISGVPYDHPRLNTYDYIGRKWPDVWQLNMNGSFDEFVIVGLILNSLLLLAVVFFCSTFALDSALPFGSLLYITNPYFIGQTIFTWPKPLAGFFILLSWTSVRLKHGPTIVAVLLALAYHSHPYAIVFAAFTGFFYLLESVKNRSQILSLFVYAGVFLACIAPWLIWTKLILHIPSDLIVQNFSGAGTEAAWASPVNFVWIRLRNLYDLVTPTMFSVYPFDLGSVINYWTYCIPGLVGVFVIIPALLQCKRMLRTEPCVWFGLLAPPAAILAVYSCPAVPVLHGYQPVLAVLVFFGVWWLLQHLEHRTAVVLLSLQALLNIAILFGRGYIVGAHI